MDFSIICQKIFYYFSNVFINHHLSFPLRHPFNITMNSWQETIVYQMTSDIFKISPTNSQHIEISFLTKECIVIPMVESSFIRSSFLLRRLLVLIDPPSIALSWAIKNTSCSDLERA